MFDTRCLTPSRNTGRTQSFQARGSQETNPLIPADPAWAWVEVTAMQQQRREEILAKRAKLEEIKRQRELRANQASAGRASIAGPSDVRHAQLTEVNSTR